MPSTARMRIPSLFVGWLLVLLAGGALADPPGRVGRLADLQGQVWMFSPESGDWVAAQRNRPLTSGDRVSTDRDGRAELRIGSAALRLDGGTELEVLELDDNAIRVQLHNGSLAARLRSSEVAREFELLTTEGRFKPQRSGRYRFDHSDETSHVTAWRGQILFEGKDNAVTVNSGQRAEVWRDGRTQYSLTEPVRDAFSDWVAARDQADERSASSRYVSPEMTGIEELDREGRWESSAEYGPLWTPYHVAPGWAPYRYGHWAWVHPWGWTWVDDARWGFAPSHYGRWVYHRSVWCWSPGHYVARPVYAPALVAWVGGPRVSVSINIGPTVGWFPLAPREIYVPAFRASERYVRSVNVTHVANVGNAAHIASNPNQVIQQTTYAHRAMAHALTVVPAEVVTNRLPVRTAAQSADSRLVRELAREPMLAQAPVAAPVAVRRVDVVRGVPSGRAVSAGAPAVHSAAPATAVAPAQSNATETRRVRSFDGNGAPGSAPPTTVRVTPAAPAVQPALATALPAAPTRVMPAQATPAAPAPAPNQAVPPGRLHAFPPAAPAQTSPERNSEPVVALPPVRSAIVPTPSPQTPRAAMPPAPTSQQPQPARVVRVHPQAEQAPAAVRAQPQHVAPPVRSHAPAVREQEQAAPRLVTPGNFERRGGGERPAGRVY